MSRWDTNARAVFLSLIVATSSANDGRAANADLKTPPTLDELVEAFFHSQDAQERASLISSIETAANDSIEVVAEAVRNARLWSPLSDACATFSFESASGGTVEVAYQLPAGYDPAHRHPMIVCMPDRAAAPSDTFTLAGDALGESADEFVLIAPARPWVADHWVPHRFSGGVFPTAKAMGHPAAADLRRLMRRACRLIHVDAGRVFLFGFGAGAEAAWVEAIAHADLFAGVIALSGHPPVPYPEQVYPFLLENLRQLPVLTVWSLADDALATARQKCVAAHNRAIVELARRASLPVVGLEMPRYSRVGLKPPSDQVSRMLGRRRPPPAGSVACWFRYPGQGHAGWLLQTRFTGDPWQATQLSILPSPTTDRDRFIAGVIQEKLAHLSGRIVGQTITIQTQRCARIDLLLEEGLVDLDKAITVRCNGKRRYHGRVRRSIRTLLTTAHEQWEFQRLAVAHLSFSIMGSVAPN